MWYSTSSGRIELELSLDDAQTGYHQGACDDDVSYLRKCPHIAAQLEKIDPELLRDELRHWGAWDAEELADHEANLDRILWLACGDIVETQFEETEE